jgi:protein-export membrane protein SecD
MKRKSSATISQRNKIRLYIVLILLVAILAGFLDYPKIWNNSVDWANNKLPFDLPHYPDLPFVLGLDLQGGTHLVYKADVSNVPTKDQAGAVEGVRDVIERRVNAFGVSEPLVQTTKVGKQYRVIVELAGIKDVNEAIKMIGETPLLEFKEQANGEVELTEEQQQQLEEYNQQAEQKAQEILQEVKNNPEQFSDIAKEKSEDLATKEEGGDLGFIAEGGPRSEFLTPIKQVAPGDIYGQIFENGEGYNILKRGENATEKQVKASHILICYEGATRCEQNISKEDARAKIEELKAQATPENFTELAKEHSTEPGADTSGGDLGFFRKGQMVPEFEEVAFNLENGQISDIVETQFGFHLIHKVDEKQERTFQVYRILIKKQKKSDIVPQQQFEYTGLTGKHLKKAVVGFNQNTNEPQIELEFNDEGVELFAKITEKNVGKGLGIFLDGESIVDVNGDGVISPGEVYAPRVNEKITSGKAVISGKTTLEEAKTLVRRLNAGALPVPIDIISQQTVGASLGQESLTKSLEAAILGLILVGLFMIIYYRLPGLISVISLCIYGIVILAIFKLIPVTLTLAGIAGFILSVGMAVDANVLIFERMKEELKLGKPLGSALSEGFRRAWPSIRDGNISTLITCVILYWFGTSIIQGFALTLLIGILISMISALLVTKTILQLVIGWNFINKINWLFLYKKTQTQESE